MGVSVYPAPASGPTLAEIQTAVATYAPSPNAWTPISTWTLGGVTSFTWSGLSGYKKYKIVTPGMSASGTIGIRINGDTGSNYISSGFSATTNYLNLNTFFIFTNGGTNYHHFNVEIEQANVNGNKAISAQYGDNGGNPAAIFDGSYATNTTINSITILSANAANFTAANASANLVHLYGAN